ncbi:Tricorn protease [Neolewinella maritima]|uniref:Tricorn protease homolog n=1 Tax=Neolewinella maritima TaxID=1383882 RepID=A0ABM9AY65_9BACT|nr:S41 family peptidase [Neolewinella maritima]CAH0999443.1 Tricorn protease [Neolewinella maritima]
MLTRLLCFFALLLCTCVRAQDAPGWLRYPVISPDGSTLAFSYQGDIFTVPTQGGRARPVTIGADYAFMPVYSPDGSQLAFASDRYGNFDVFVMPATGGAARRLTYHSGGDYPYTFTPDGSAVVFGGRYQDAASNMLFPSGAQPELYRVAVDDGTISQVFTVPAEEARYAGDYLYYQDQKGYENEWRKHHTSAIARDIWRYRTADGSYQQLTDHAAEDRHPVPSKDGQTVYFLSERSGDFNVFSMPAAGGEATQLTTFERHPVRFLSSSDDGLLAFSWHGELYTLRPGEEAQKVDIQLNYDGRQAQDAVKPLAGEFTEATLSPNGKEYAFVVRGEVFVSSVETGTTKRITNTARQERSVSWHPEGRALYYASESDTSWDIMKTSIDRDEEPYFFTATLLQEEPVVTTEAEEFQPIVSPDGEKVAYLKNRKTVMVRNLKSGKDVMVLGPEHNYSYSDGDMHFAWSPDSRYLAADFGRPERVAFFTNVALLDITKENEPTNVTFGGYSDGGAKFSRDGSLLYYYSVREGNRAENGWFSGDGNTYALYLTRAARDRATLSEEEFGLVKEGEEKEKKEEDEKKDKEDQDSLDVEPLEIEWAGLEDRKKRLTEFTDAYADQLLSEDGETLFYLADTDGKYNLHKIGLRNEKTESLAELGADRAGGMELSRDGKSIFLLADGNPVLVTIADGTVKKLQSKGEMVLKAAEERAYIFDHAWRQMREKFYVEDMQGVDWAFYRDAYRPKLKDINNNYDFAELLSEMLGETNASHTGSGFRMSEPLGDKTAALGMLFSLDGESLVVEEVLRDGPLDKADVQVEAGDVLTAVNGQSVSHLGQLHQALNRTAGQRVLLTFQSGKDTHTETVEPISTGAENELLYDRWVRQQRALVDSLSGGELGYVHVRAMNDASMRDVVDAALGRHIGAKALVVDIRFNGGGNLHDRLADFLDGKAYMDLIPHGQYIGSEPLNRWTKPSIVLVNESSYSDSHIFPVAYTIKGIGKTVGMPVPGTGTFVWWETQIDPTLYFGIPMGGWKVEEGYFLENTQFEPTLKVQLQPGEVAAGKDAQTEAAVEELLR